MRARYLAIIIDGNGRWAKRRGLPILAGHRAGARNLRDRLLDAAELGVEELSVFAFSTENWSRSGAEVGRLMGLMGRYVEQATPELHRQGVRMRFIGRRGDPIPAELGERVEWAERLTATNGRITLAIALNYGGRAEILDAARSFDGSGEEEFRAHLYAPDLHDPQILIRTGAERRLSNYLLWQCADSELVFRDELWPDFDRVALAEVLAQFETRTAARPLPHSHSPPWA